MLNRRHMLALVFVLSVGLTLAFVPRSADAGLDSLGNLEPVRTAFLPSQHGFGFKNSFSAPSDPYIVRALSGRCGGMSYGSLDYFHRGQAPPADAPLKEYLLARSVDSVVANIARFTLWSVWPDTANSRFVHGVGELTRHEETPRLVKALQSGPVPLGLVRANSISELGRNHQVVAYAVEQRGDIVVVSVYDSNRPLSDDVRLEFDITAADSPVIEYAGDDVIATWRGMFVERYAPAAPPK
jgi:hypothetical protein